MADFKLDRFKYNWRGEWSTGTAYILDDVVSYGASSFVCITAHTAAGLFSTDLNNQDLANAVPAPRWVKMTDGYAWRDQWTNGQVYDPGDVVVYGGNLYLCIASHLSSFVFDNDLIRWTVYSTQIAWRQNWAAATRYGVNDVVRYGGIVYRCIEGHTSASTSSGLEQNQLSWIEYNIGEEYRGEWSIGDRYREGDLVKLGGSVYRCKKNNTPADDSSINFDQEEFWEIKFSGYQFRGEWNNETTYRTGDVVRNGGWLFYSLTDNFDSHPVTSIYQLIDRTDSVDWEIVSKGINFRGDWSSDENYKTGDVVRRGGRIYVALLDTEATADGSSLDYLDSSNWELVNEGQYFRSFWSEDTDYAVGDVVVFFGTAFVCKLEHLSDNINFPTEDISAAGTGFQFWDTLVAGGSEYGLQYRGDLLTYNLKRDFYGDDSSFGFTNVRIGEADQLVTINSDDTVIYKSYGQVNRVFYVAENGEDDAENSERGLNPSKPWRTVRFACERADDGFAGTTTVRVRTGRFEEILPIIVPARVAIVGDELRSTTIVASKPIASLSLDSTYTIAVLNRISQIIQTVIAGTDLNPPKTPTNTLNPIVLTETIEETIFNENQTPITVVSTVSLRTDPQSSADIQILISNIINYINFFINSTGVNPAIVSTNQATADQEYLNAVEVLLANKEFLVSEAVAFMQTEFPSYNFDQMLFRKNIRRYIDAWAYDITYTGNYKSILEARYYRNSVLGSKSDDMFYFRDSTGLRMVTVAGLEGSLNPPNVNDIFRLPTGGSYVSLDPGWGPNDDRTWIINRSPYIQNVTTIGRGCTGQKIDGALHNGGNKSIVSNDFTQVIDDGIGAWVLNQGRAELVSVFSYYAHVGYLATNGGIIRGTNGNNSYGRFGAIADGNDNSEIPIAGTVNNRNQQASATVFAGDFTDEIQIVEWNNAGQDYTQAAATFIGAGANAAVTFDDFRDEAVHTVIRLDTSTTLAQNIGGGGYIRVQNNAQVQEEGGNDLISIRIASNDPNSAADYLGCRIIITGGPGTGQYGYITAYNTTTKVVSVSRESNDQPGWDHIIPGTPISGLLSSSTAYRIEPRAIFSAPDYNAEQFNIGLNTNWGAVVYGETTETYTNIAGQAGTGSVEGQDGLIPVTATFNVNKIGRTYSVTINEDGAGYQVNDEILILGTQLGGNSPYNDLTIKVTAVTDDSTNAITSIFATGIGASGRFVAVTEGGTAGLYSKDGASWPDGFSMPSAGDWTCLAAGNNRFVAIRTNSAVAASSLNGITWTASTMPANRSWKAVTYGGDRFVAIASDQDSAAYSTNGTTWTASTLPDIGDSATNEWVDITYGRGQFVAVANSQNVSAYSTNGISWTAVVMNEDSTVDAKDWTGIAYGNNRYVTIASTGEVLYSFNATTWLSASLPVTDGTVRWSKIKYAQGVFFALAGSENNNNTDVAATSPDGIVWTMRELASAASWKGLAFGNPYIEQFDSTIGKSTPVWVAISESNITNRIRTGATALGRVEITAGVVAAVKLWDTGSGYGNEPTLTLVSPTSTSNAVFRCRVTDGVLSNPTWNNRGVGYRTGTTRVVITGNGAADVIPVGKFLTLENLDKIPGPGAQIFFAGNPIRYNIVTLETITNTINGSNSAFIRVTPELRVRDDLTHATAVSIREQYSQVRITGHDFLDIGTGNFLETNYPELYSGLFFSAPEDEVREENGGRVFYTSSDQSGNFRTGELFAVEQATGIVTISADFFDLSGLEDLRLGGIRVGGSGAVIREFSTDPTFTEDSNNIIPTQRAIRSFLANRLSLGGSEVSTFQIQAGQVFLGGPDRISNALGLKVVIPVMANFAGAGSGISGAMLAQNMFYRSFN
jgi:hypothetical protein